MLRPLKAAWRILFIAVSCFSIAIWIIRNRNPPSHDRVFPHHVSGRSEVLHLLIPATTSNVNLCQLFISAGVLGYPAPTLINWGAHEDADEYVQHLAKVQGVLDFLDSVPTHQQDDLLLLVDGYDTWFQLPAHILIERYYAVQAELNRSSSERYSAQVMKDHDIKDTVIFGPDKLCWPDDPLRLACWIAPDSPLSAQAFGPDTDRGIVDHNRPRWLNSGTIMGTVSGVQAVFAAALAKIRNEYVSNSDQLYFAQLFGEQTYSRRLQQLRYDQRSYFTDTTAAERDLLPSPHSELKTADELGNTAAESPTQKEIPNLLFDTNVEHHIALDYKSSLFQTVAYYEDYITWINHSLLATRSSSFISNANRYYNFSLPSDLASDGPLHLTMQSLAPAHYPMNTAFKETMLTAAGSSYDTHTYNFSPEFRTWSALPLGVNTVTKETFSLLHFTGKKGYRELWWRKNWFYPCAEHLLKWRRMILAQARESQNIDVNIYSREIGEGAWTVKGKWLEWKEICGRYEQGLFGTNP